MDDENIVRDFKRFARNAVGEGLDMSEQVSSFKVGLRISKVLSSWSGFVKGLRTRRLSYVAEAAAEINLSDVAGLTVEVAILDIELVNGTVYVIGMLRAAKDPCISPVWAKCIDPSLRSG